MENKDTHPKPFGMWQHQFVSTNADEICVVGNGGAGKTWAILYGAAQHLHHPSYRALLMRGTYPDVRMSLMSQAPSIYLPLGGVYQEREHTWRFPSGATIQFGSCEHEDGVYKYAGMNFHYVGLDTLNGFDEWQYKFMMSRLRGTEGITFQMRSTVHENHKPEWVVKRFAPWLSDPKDDHYNLRAEPGHLVHYLRDESICGIHRIVSGGTPGAISRTVIMATYEKRPVPFGGV